MSSSKTWVNDFESSLRYCILKNMSTSPFVLLADYLQYVYGTLSIRIKRIFTFLFLKIKYFYKANNVFDGDPDKDRLQAV